MAESGWQKREQGTFVKLGDGEGQVAKAEGMLVDIQQGNYDNLLYNLIQQDGELHTVPGSASIDNQLGSHDVGEFVRLDFMGWGESKAGRKFKLIEVRIWTAEYTDEMKAWPRFKDFHGANGKPTQRRDDSPAEPKRPKDFDEKPDAVEQEEAEGDDLPF